MKKYLNPKGMGVLKALDDAAKKHNANPTQVALAWLMQRKSITAPIVSATSLQQLKDLIAAPERQARCRDVAAIDKASAPESLQRHCHSRAQRGTFAVATKVPRASPSG